MLHFLADMYCILDYAVRWGLLQGNTYCTAAVAADEGNQLASAFSLDEDTSRIISTLIGKEPKSDFFRCNLNEANAVQPHPPEEALETRRRRGYSNPRYPFRTDR